MNEREAFETWWQSRPGIWRGTDHDLRFEVWKAATAAERERCAKACDDDAFVDQWKGLAEAKRRILGA